ncbi:NAD-dependent epimerase/dehydratase family protein [Planktotalea sp.]|uniref:NAD-dependent epimerase/dehydratase family protein n=1 Tax=Planktotalea sp. TaxID=2029877 RepID=UPI003D6B4C48
MGALKPLHIVVTGSAGYLGRAIVEAAETRGHHVSKIVRSGDSGIVQDLAETGAAERLAQEIGAADVVIHAASEMTSDWARHEASSLPAMQTVCAVSKALNAHLVHISSIAIYDFESLKAGSIVTEQSPIEPNPEQRDGYSHAKLAQEEIIADEMPNASVLRVGAIFGATRIMNAHLGIGLGPILLRLASRGQVPLAHIDLVAQSALNAAINKSSGAVNILDTDLPDRIRFIETLSASGWPKLVIPCPWQAFSVLSKLLAFWSSRPGLLRTKVLHARMKPLAYDNALMRASLVHEPEDSFEAKMTKAMRHE